MKNQHSPRRDPSNPPEIALSTDRVQTSNTPPAPANSPAVDSLTGWGDRRRRLTDTEVKELREAYRYRRDLAETASSADEWETVTETLKRLADSSNGLVTPSALNRLVLGESYANAPGPLDTMRIARRAQSKDVSNRLGGKAARSMASSGYRDTALTHVVIQVTRPSGGTKEFTYPAGTAVTVINRIGGKDPAEKRDKD